MNTTLEDLRNEWEQEARVMFHVKPNAEEAYTVLHVPEPAYRRPYYVCLRYFKISEIWHVSSDHNDLVNVQDVFKWLEEQLS